MIDVQPYSFATDVHWPLGEDSSSPYYLIPDGKYKRRCLIDPYPAYSHDVEMVRQLSVKAYDAFPVGVDVAMCCFDREGTGRTNGMTYTSYDYSAEVTPKPWTASIVLFGKRIPLHPAMTRYLVAHEYGHVVAKYLGALYGLGEDQDAFCETYAGIRGLEWKESNYDGGLWETQIGEILANDFRILVLGEEEEFWPHFAPHPRLAGDDLSQFWQAEAANARQTA